MRKRSQYDKNIAALLASVAGWSYADLDDFQRILTDNETISLSEADFVEISARNDSMLIAATAQIIRTCDKKTAVVCFRGTEPLNLANWGTDLNSSKVSYLSEEIKVQQGFLANFRYVWDGLEGIISYLKDPSKMNEDEKCGEDPPLENIYFTGHSLGGAMAFLAGLYMSYNPSGNVDDIYSKVRGIYTYGQPMVIDPSSVDKCKDLFGHLLFRHVYYNDIVPHVPTLSMGFYAHIGREFRYRPWPCHKWKEIDWGKVTQIPFALPVIPGVLWDAVGNSIILPFSLFKSPWSLTDHSPTKYINSLSKNMGQQKESGILMLSNYVIDGAEEEIVVQKSPQTNGNY